MLRLMLSPMAPHIAEELWQMLGHQNSLAREKWPQYRDDLAREEQFEVIIQINGRLRGKILVEDDLSEEESLNRALTDPRIAMLLAGKEITKTVVAPPDRPSIVLRSHEFEGTYDHGYRNRSAAASRRHGEHAKGNCGAGFRRAVHAADCAAHPRTAGILRDFAVHGETRGSPGARARGHRFVRRP